MLLKNSTQSWCGERGKGYLSSLAEPQHEQKYANHVTLADS